MPGAEGKFFSSLSAFVSAFVLPRFSAAEFARRQLASIEEWELKKVLKKGREKQHPTRRARDETRSRAVIGGSRFAAKTAAAAAGPPPLVRRHPVGSSLEQQKRLLLPLLKPPPPPPLLMPVLLLMLLMMVGSFFSLARFPRSSSSRLELGSRSLIQDSQRE